jgi:hypothetical protein
LKTRKKIGIGWGEIERDKEENKRRWTRTGRKMNRER